MLVEVAIVVGLVLGPVPPYCSCPVLGALSTLGGSAERELLSSEAEREAETIRGRPQIEAREDSIRLRAEVERELSQAARDHPHRGARARGGGAGRAQAGELARREQGMSDREATFARSSRS